MRGHVRKRGERWAFVVELGRDPATGKRRQKWVSGFASERSGLSASAGNDGTDVADRTAV